METKLWSLELNFITVVFVLQAQYGIITSESCNGTCPTNDCGWVYYSGYCYIFTNNNFDRSQAVSECSNYRSSMIRSVTNDTNNFLVSQMKSASAWLGLNDQQTEGIFVWNNWHTNPLSENDYKNWNTGHPKENGEDFDFVEIERSTGKWNNIYGNESIGNICMKYAFQGPREPCRMSALGMEYKRIPDDNITAPNETGQYPASQGRLGYQGAWCGQYNYPGYLQVTLSTIFFICAVSTQGHFESQKGFVKTYRLELSTSENKWNYYKAQDGVEIINGNKNNFDGTKRILQDGVMAKDIRFWPTTWHNYPCMRVEIYGKEAEAGATLFPEGIKVINTSYDYVDIRWKNTRPQYFFYGSLRGYIVTLEKMGDSSEDGTLIFTSCHSEGINITDLEEDTTYCVYVAAFTEYGKGNRTSCMVAVTGERARVDFTAFNESSTSIRLNWNSDLPIPIQDNDKRGIKISYRKAEDTVEVNMLFCDSTTTYVFSNLTIFTNYCFAVVGFKNDVFDTKLDNSKCVHTGEEAPRGPPLNVTARNESSTSINVTWEPIAAQLQHGVILGHRISYKKGSPPGIVSRRKRRSLQLLETTVLGDNNLTWTLEGLEKFANYCIQIVGFNGKGDGNTSDLICAMTDEDVPSISPIFTAGFNTSSTSLTIEWSSIPPNLIHGYLLGYIITYEINSKVDGPMNAVTINTNPQESSKNISGLLVYTEYCVRVAGRTRIGAGIWSACLNITTDEEVPSSPPIDLKAVDANIIDTNVTLTWNPPTELNGKLTGYRIVVEHTSENNTLQTRNLMTCNNNITLTGLNTSFIYTIKVAASTRKGLGPHSEYVHGELCDCPETLQVVEDPSPLDEDHGHGSLTWIIKSLVMEACGNCQKYASGTTTLLKAAEAADADITFPVIKFLDGAQSTTESRFVAVLVVPGLAVIQRKPEKQLGAYEKVMASSVVDSWPIFAIFGAMTLSAALVIWVLDVNTNPEEFPPTFYKGAGEGLWWAFITMTTLGYGDRTPKSNPAKVFAMMWFVVGLVMFGLFSSAVTSSLTVVVANGGPEGDISDKLLNISTIKDSQEKHVVVRKLSNRFTMSTEYKTVEKLVEALRAGDTDAILLDMYVQMKRKDLFNDSSPWFKVVEIVEKEMAHGIELRGASISLEKEIKNFIREKNVETEFLADKTHELEDEEEHDAHVVIESEEESLVFFEPASPFFVFTLQFCGGVLGGFILCGIIYEAFRWKWGNIKHIKRHCQDEDDMRKLVEEFYRNFTRTYKTLRKKGKDLIKLRKKLHTTGTVYMNSDLEDAKLW